MPTSDTPALTPLGTALYRWMRENPYDDWYAVEHLRWSDDDEISNVSDAHLRRTVAELETAGLAEADWTATRLKFRSAAA
jgi:hypothetical protein